MSVKKLDDVEPFSRVVFITSEEMANWRPVNLHNNVKGKSALDIISGEVWAVLYPNGAIYDRKNGRRKGNYRDLYDSLKARI